MDAFSPPPPPQPLHSAAEYPSENGVAHSSTAEAEIPTTSETSAIANGTKTTKIKKRKKLKKERQFTDLNYQDSASSSSTATGTLNSNSRFSAQRRGIRLFNSRRNPKSLSGLHRHKPGYLEAIALPLGMSIAAIVAQIMERKDAVQDKVMVDHLSQICASAVRESLLNVFGDEFDIFVENFEKSFRSTLMTLQLINKSTKTSGGNRRPVRGKYSSEGAAAGSSFSRLDDLAGDFGSKECWSETLSQVSSRDEQAISSHEDVQDSTSVDLRNQQLILHDRQIMEQLDIVSPSERSGAFDSSNDQTVFSTLERSVMEQARSNDLKTFEMRLTMKKIQLKERQLALGSDSNFLERCKLSLGFSKTSFKIEKFKTQLEDTRHAELLKRCIDCLVSGLFIMLACIAYGVFVFSHQRITEVTAACSSSTSESKSWWMPKPVSSINSGMQILKCQFQVLTRLFAGGILVLLIAYLLLQRSATANQTMPVTFLVLLLGLLCGVSGKLCIDTLGGSGNCWLSLWWTFCSVHIFSNVWTSALFAILYGPITVTEKMKADPHVPYWLRRFLFYTTSALILPLLCGFLPFASLGEWKDHFSSLFFHHMLVTEDL